MKKVKDRWLKKERSNNLKQKPREECVMIHIKLIDKIIRDKCLVMNHDTQVQDEENQNFKSSHMFCNDWWKYYEDCKCRQQNNKDAG